MSGFKTRDHYFEKAKTKGYKARSIFKLEAIDKSLNMIQMDSIVLDLGCAPGSWLQYVAQKIGKQGAALGIDLTAVKLKANPRIKTVVDDCFCLTKEKIENYMSSLVKDFTCFDVVLSDMAPKTTGIKHVDQTRSLMLAENALQIAERLLRPGGFFVVKIFDGPEAKEFVLKVKKLFATVKQMRPEAVRTVSKEFYVVGINKR